MEMSSTSSKKLIIRYFSNPSFLSFLSLSLSSSPKTLNHSLSLTPLNAAFQSHQLHRSHSLYSSSSTASPSDCSGTRPFSQSLHSFAVCKFSTTSNYRYPVSFIGLFRPHGLSRWFSVSSSDRSLSSISSETVVVPDKNSGFENLGIACFDESEFMGKTLDSFQSNVSPKQVSEIVEMIKSGENDLYSKLSLMGLSLSVTSISEIFRVLNCERISALHFSQWVKDINPKLYYNPHVCSLITDNCGWLDDYGTMISVLKEFKSKGICLTEKAFGFLPVLGSSNTSLMESIRRLIEALNEVGGSCRGSGICELIRMLCMLDSFELAKFVIEITERKVSYYNILIRERCRRCHFEEVHALLKEMGELGCDMSAKTYNYLLGSLCKSGRKSEACTVLKEMLEQDTPPDTLTFEIFIYFSCMLGKLDFASQFLDQMVSMGLEPRLTTHAAFVKGFFSARQYEEAYKYVHSSGVRYVRSSNMIYSLLASLHQKKGDLVVARNILIEMMEMGLKPNFPVYLRIMKQLLKTGRGHLAGDLKSRFSRFRVESSIATG